MCAVCVCIFLCVIAPSPPRAFRGHITDAAGNKRLLLSGLWCSHVDAVECNWASGEPLRIAAGAGAAGAGARRLWSCAPKPAGDHYGMTHYARKLDSCEDLRYPPLPSDSRRRADRAALAGRHMPKAAAEKARLEEGQRHEKVHRERGGGAPWVPRWFEGEAGLTLLPGEMEADKVPTWRWVEGGFDRVDGQLAANAGVAAGVTDSNAEVSLGQPGSVRDADVCGQGFAPWQFPELHK